MAAGVHGLMEDTQDLYDVIGALAEEQDMPGAPSSLAHAQRTKAGSDLVPRFPTKQLGTVRE